MSRGRPPYYQNRWRRTRDGDLTGHMCPNCDVELIAEIGTHVRQAICPCCGKTTSFYELGVREDLLAGTVREGED